MTYVSRALNLAEILNEGIRPDTGAGAAWFIPKDDQNIAVLALGDSVRVFSNLVTAPPARFTFLEETPTSIENEDIGKELYITSDKGIGFREPQGGSGDLPSLPLNSVWVGDSENEPSPISVGGASKMVFGWNGSALGFFSAADLSLGGGGNVPGTFVAKGEWDATSGAPTSTPTAGDYYTVSVAGTFQGAFYGTDDAIYYASNAWRKIEGGTGALLPPLPLHSIWVGDSDQNVAPVTAGGSNPLILGWDGSGVGFFSAADLGVSGGGGGGPVSLEELTNVTGTPTADQGVVFSPDALGAGQPGFYFTDFIKANVGSYAQGRQLVSNGTEFVDQAFVPIAAGTNTGDLLFWNGTTSSYYSLPVGSEGDILLCGDTGAAPSYSSFQALLDLATIPAPLYTSPDNTEWRIEMGDDGIPYGVVVTTGGGGGGGTTDNYYVSFSNNASQYGEFSWAPSGSDVTIRTRVWFEGVNDRCIFGGNPYDDMYLVLKGSGQSQEIQFWIKGSSLLSVGMGLGTGQWYDIEVQKVGQTVSFYKDGNLVSSATTSKLVPTTAQNYRIGLDITLGSAAMNGRIDYLELIDPADDSKTLKFSMDNQNFNNTHPGSTWGHGTNVGSVPFVLVS